MYSQRDVADHGVIVPQRLSRIFMVKIYCPIDGKFDIVRHVDYMPCDFNAVVVIYIVFFTNGGDIDNGLWRSPQIYNLWMWVNTHAHVYYYYYTKQYFYSRILCGEN